MILWTIILDIVINNFTQYTSYFFIISLYNKKYKYYLCVGLILDFIIFETIFLNTIILSIIYILNRLLKELNKDNIYNYIFINLFNYLLFIILSNIFSLNGINNILLRLGANLIVNLIFYILSYRVYITCHKQ